MKQISLYLAFAAMLFIYCNEQRIYAANLESTRFRIEAPSINTGGKTGTSAGYSLNTTLGQTAAGEFSSTGYVVKAGFQYIHSIIPFYFSISDTNVSFGTVTPQSAATDSITLEVDFGAAGQYEVTAEELQEMSLQNGNDTIPDTTCNGGGDTCTETSAKTWNSSTTYGFGYNMQGSGIPTDFISSAYYRPFPNRTLVEAPAVVMSSLNVVKNHQSTMTFKVNVAPNQSAGTYSTVVNFIATPTF